MSRPKFIVGTIASLILSFLTLFPAQVAQSQTAGSDKAIADFTVMQESKFCGKISVLDNLIAKHGSQNLLLKSKEAGQPQDFELLVYYDPKGKRFTIVKIYAKKNQACIVMSGYNVQLEPGVTNPSVEGNE